MRATERLIQRFYRHFSRRDVGGMVACYHADVELTHPAISEVRSWRAAAFWEMFFASERLLGVEVTDLRAYDDVTEARWEARYAGSGGRTKCQQMRASLRFRGGRIVRHDEHIEVADGARTVGPHALLREERAAIAPLVHAGVQRALAMFIIERSLIPREAAMGE
jgi:ketosteroid isomerase-like protein